MKFNDIFKSTFINNINTISVVDISLALILSFLIGMFILYVYKKTFNGVMYSSSFGVTLVALTMITTLIILAVTSNVVLSLGMVGALSIVRFRAAIKDPLDIAFLFWSIGVGIVLAAGMLVLAILGSILIGLALIVLVNKKTYNSPYILIAHCKNSESEDKLSKELSDYTTKRILKSKTVSKNSIEITYDVRLKSEDT